MQLEQAIFTSARTRHTQGYHLTARSPGIGEELAHALSQWSPSHGGLLSPEVDAASLNYFPLSSSRGALARSVYGGPEYSDRGGLQVVTRMLVFHHEQLAGYGGNPLHLARLALSLGHLRLDGNATPLLETIELPKRTILVLAGRDEPAEPTAALQQVAQRLHSASRVAVIGAADPQQLVADLLSLLPPRERLGLSFTTGLKPSLHRQFRLQFLPAADSRTRGQLAAQGIECVDAAA